MNIRKHFERMILINTLMLLGVVSIVITAVVSLYAYNETKKQAATLAHAAAVVVDVQALHDAADSGDVSEQYYKEYRQLAKIKEKVKECVYMYCFAPREEDALYVFNVYTQAEIDAGIGYEPEVDLGYHESWSNLGYAYDIYKTGEEVDKAEISLFFENDYGNLISYYAPVYDADGELKLIVGVDFAFSYFVLMILLIIVLILVLISISLMFLSRIQLKNIDENIVDSILLIEEKTKGFAGSEHKGAFEEYLLPENGWTTLELNTLASSINKMIKDIEDYIQNLEAVTAEKERVATELTLAASIQANSLPSVFPAFPDIKEIDLYAIMDPAKEVGGDFYDFFMIDETHMAFVIADVAGKGVPAALFMMISKALIKNQAGSVLNPAQVLENVNKQLCENNDDNMFVTAWIGILDITTGRLEASNAGHEYPAIRRAGGEFELLKNKHGLALGTFDIARYRSYDLILNPGDSLFVYTDGVPEATNAAGELFGTDRMLVALNQNPECDTETRLKLVRTAIDDFVKDAPQFDDLTMLSVNFQQRVTTSC